MIKNKPTKQLAKLKLLNICVLLLLTAASPTKSCDSKNKPSRLQRATLEHQGLSRSYYYYIPKSLSSRGAHPLVLALHGGGTKPKNSKENKKAKLPGLGMHLLLKGTLTKLAEKEKFIVIYPEGINSRWNDGRDENRKITNNADDLGFISKLIDHFVRKNNVSRSRVYATGFSNGAIMNFTLACKLPNKIAAIAPVDGTVTSELINSCKNSRPTPLMLTHGTEYPRAMRSLNKLMGHKPLEALKNTEDLWSQVNHCSSTSITSKIPDRKKDGTTIEKITYKNCAAPLEIYKIQGGGHTWPNGAQYRPKFLIGKTTKNMEATKEIWNFLKKHRR